MDNSIKNYYDEKLDAKYLPLGLGSFGQVCLEQPVIMCIYCGFVERFGLDNLQILRQLADSCSVYSAFQIKLITLQATIEALDKNLETTNGGYKKQLDILDAKRTELEKLMEKFDNNFKDDNDAGMLVNSDRITLKVREIQNDISDKQDLATEKAKFEFQIRKTRSDIDMLTQKIEKYCVQFKKLLEVFSVRNIDCIERFAVGDEKEVDKVILCGVATTNEMFKERYGATVKVDEVKIKTRPFIKFVQSYFRCLLKMAEYTAELNKKSEKGSLTKKDLMVAKRLETISKSYQQHLAEDRGMKFVYANLPTNFDGKQKGAFKLYSKQVDISLSEKADTNLLSNRQVAIDMAQKYSDPFIVAIATAVDDMCTKNFNLNTIDSVVADEEFLEEDAPVPEAGEETVEKAEAEVEEKIETGAEEMEDNVANAENLPDENPDEAVEGEEQSDNVNAEQGETSGQPAEGVPNMAEMQPNMGYADPNMMQNQFVDPNAMQPNMGYADPNMMQNQFVDPSAMQPNMGYVDPNMMQNQFVDPNTMQPNMGYVDPNMMQNYPNNGFDPNGGMPQ